MRVYRIRLRTTLKIPTGGELYASYTHSLLPTMLRREHLLEGKNFACACPRCSDPTELGTHMSSLKCNKCDNGIILPLDSLGITIYAYIYVCYICTYTYIYIWISFLNNDIFQIRKVHGIVRIVTFPPMDKPYEKFSGLFKRK